jgi:hypothetical protein
MIENPRHIPQAIREKWETKEWKHASAVLKEDFPEEWNDLMVVLSNFRLKGSHIKAKGGNKSPIAQSINGAFASRGWKEKQFEIMIDVDGEQHYSPTHKVDYFKNRIAIETEWNNKDPFYDRDLNNFRLLHQLDVISVGVIITRSDELQKIFASLKKAYTATTTHMSQLLPRLEGGGAGGCPVLVFGITQSLYDKDFNIEEAMEETDEE